MSSFCSMEADKPGDARCNGAAVADHVEITFAQRLAALVWRICCLEGPRQRREPDETARVPGQIAPVGPTAHSEQPSSLPPPDPRTNAATAAAEGTGGSAGATDDGDGLPKDYQNILDRLVAPVKYSSKAELYSIFRKNLLIDDSTKSFTLGKLREKCYMLSSRYFDVSWLDVREHWRIIRFPDSRFSEVLVLVKVSWFTLHCKFNTKDLSEHTNYSVLLVYMCTKDLCGLEDDMECLVKVGARESSRRRVCLGAVDEDDGPPVIAMAPSGAPRTRTDGWTEVEVGVLSVEERRDQIMELRIEEHKSQLWKRGIIIEGVELRAQGTDESSG